MKQSELTVAQCQPCQGGVEAMTATVVLQYMPMIDSDWQYQEQQAVISRTYKFKNFSKTMFFVNAVAQIADQQGHHPDVQFGYNYCQLSFTTHEAKGVTVNDFICAKKVDQLLI
jgi:4a-hydroxytetrahydrobiopterin dehydratase